MKYLTRWIASGIGGLALTSHADLVAHYKFDETAGTVAADELTTSDATIEGAVEFVPGVDGGAFSFNGDVANNVTLANAPFLAGDGLGGDFTISAWVSFTELNSAVAAIVCLVDQPGPNNSYTDLSRIGDGGENDGSFLGRTRGGGNNITQAISETPFADGNFHHVAFVVNSTSGSVTLYIDGALDGTTNGTPMLAAFTDFTVGHLDRPSGQTDVDAFTGSVDDLQFYDDALTTNQVAFLSANPGSPLPSEDSDGDGLNDFWEDENFGNNDGIIEPEDLTPQSGTDDPDGDDTNNEQEEAAGTDPNVADSDDDGLTDGEEINGTVNPWTDEVSGTPPGDPTDPLEPDSDGDGLTDGDELDASTGSPFITNPNDNDTDGDELLDAWEIDNDLDPTDGTGENGDLGDPDEDDLENFQEQEAGSDPQLADTDEDGLSDGEEVSGDLNPWFEGVNDAIFPGDPTSPILADTDGDGIDDLDEIDGTSSFITDPNNADTDGDGLTDGEEIADNSDPLNADDPNPSGITTLLAHYKFDETSGTVAADELGNSDAVIEGAVGFVDGVDGGAFSFDGNVANNVTAAEAPFLVSGAGLGGGNFTISAWVSFEDISTNVGAIVTLVDQDGPANHYTDLSRIGNGTFGGGLDGQLFGRTRTGSGAALLQTASPDAGIFNDGTFHHVTFVVDSTNNQLQVFVDGVLDTSASGAPVLADFSDLTIGHLDRPTAQSDTDAFTGLVDDVQIYRNALTATQAQYLSGNPGAFIEDTDEDGLDDWWEQLYFSNLDMEGSDDPDMDGFTNEEEETAGTDPTVAGEAAELQITDIALDGTEATLSFTGNANADYLITGSTDLMEFDTTIDTTTNNLTATVGSVAEEVITTDGDGNATVTFTVGSDSFFRVEETP